MKRFKENEELAIIEFYLTPETLSTTANFFHRKNNTIKKILKKYNIPLHTDQVNTEIQQNKRKKTCLEKYGVESYTKTTEFKSFMQDNYEIHRLKTIETCQEHYGVDNPHQVKEVIEKTKLTNIQKYGVENVFQSEAIKEKSKKTNLERYGVEYNLQADIFKQKANETKLARYGRTDIGQFGSEEHTNAMIAKYGSKTFKGASCYQYDNLFFDSFPELAVYIYAIDHNIPIIREPIKFPFKYNNKEYNYIPDFKYNNFYLEIKGSQFLKEDGSWQNIFDHNQDDIFEAKHQCAIRNNVVIWYEDDYKFALDYFNSKYKKEDFRRMSVIDNLIELSK